MNKSILSSFVFALLIFSAKSNAFMGLPKMDTAEVPNPNYVCYMSYDEGKDGLYLVDTMTATVVQASRAEYKNGGREGLLIDLVQWNLYRGIQFDGYGTMAGMDVEIEVKSKGLYGQGYVSFSYAGDSDKKEIKCVFASEFDPENDYL